MAEPGLLDAPVRSIVKTHRPLLTGLSSSSSWCVCAALFATSVAVAGAQQSPRAPQTPQPPPTPSPPRPTFRTGTNAVVVDLRVVDRDGTFVGDLSKDDFRIFEDDKEQAVATFSLVNIPIEVSRERSATASRVDPDVTSNNYADEGRLYLIVLDDAPRAIATPPPCHPAPDGFQSHPLRAPTVRALAREFVERHLTDVDQAALVTLSGRRDMTREFTYNPQRLLEAIDRFEANFGSPYAWCHTGSTLASYATWLSEIDGRRKAVVFVTENVRVLLENTPEMNDELQRLLAAAARANVSLYIIDPTGVPTGRATGIKPVPLDDVQDLGDAMDRRMALNVLAEATGGSAFGTHSNDYAAAFERIVEENSSYYLLGYTPTNTNQDGKLRKIRVEVRRPGGATSVGRFAELEVRARSGYAPEKPLSAPTPAPNALPPDLADLIKSPVPVAGLTLSAVAAPFQGAGSRASVAVIVEVRAGDLLLADQDARFSGAMEMAIVAADADGKIKGSERGTLTMRFLPATRDAVAARGVRMLSEIELEPGEYHMSVAVVDAGGGRARGSVRYDVTVPDFSKSFTMSGIAIASVATSVIPTNGSAARWKQSLGLIPTTVRAFGPDDELRVFAEIYDNDRLPHRTTVTTTVRAVSGTTVFTVQQVLTRSANQTTHPVVTTIPLVDVAPGEYVLTVEARSSATPDRPISRQVPLNVR